LAGLGNPLALSQPLLPVIAWSPIDVLYKVCMTGPWLCRKPLQ
jgi:hypothetical protein